jgi:FMN-dependent NADH-azoreductase
MYNYGVPALLKAWIDRITFPGAFVDPVTGGLRLSGTHVVVLAASGGAYGEGSPRQGWDHHVPHLRTWCASIGVRAEDVHVVRAELTLAPVVEHLAAFRPQAERSLADAEAAVARLAERLGDELIAPADGDALAGAPRC